ncbi:Putative lipoprotein LppC [bacterium HR19]|nr:Putative lipoprotein LppC [bacterium HR19]
MSGEKIKLSHIMKFFIFVVFFYSLLNFCNDASTEKKEEVKKMEIKSSAFKNGERIPKKYTCEGEDFSPPLEWSGAPAGTKSFVIIVDDPDAPIGTFNHWVIYDIPSSYSSLKENLPKTPELQDKIKQGTNDFGRIGWGGPCPPKGHGTHRYFFKLMALSVESLGLKPGARKSEVIKAVEGKVLAEAQFYGTCSR